MDDVCAVIGKRSAGLVCHGVYDAEQSVGERHTGQTLCVVHVVTGGHIAVIGRDKVLHDHLDCVDGERVGEIAVCGGNIRFNRMGHSIHTGVRNELLRHRLGKVRVNDGDIRGNLEVGDRVLDALLIIGDDGERGHFRCGAGSRGNGAEVCLLAKLRQAEDLAHILKRNVRVFIFDPHSFCGIDRRAAAHRDDPIRLELDHLLRTLHNGLNRRVRLNAFNQLDLHAGFLQIADCTVQKAETLHGAAAYTNNSLLAFKMLQFFQSTLAMIQIAGKCKSCHKSIALSM